jgi:hypothetical protein
MKGGLAMGRALVIVLSVLVVLLVVGRPASAQPALTEAQLARAIVTRSDLGSGWVARTPGPRGRELVNYGAEFDRPASNELAGVILADSAKISPYHAARQVLEENIELLRDDVETVTPFDIGRAPVRFYFTTRGPSGTRYGDVIAWRHGPVTAVVVLVTDDRDTFARPIAVRQQERLAAAFPLGR